MKASAPSVIYALVKLFENEQYAQDFVRGDLFMNSLAHFRALEDPDGQRGDAFEGIGAILQPAQISEIRFDDIAIPPTDLAAPIIMTPASLAHANVFCMHAFHNHGRAVVSAATLGDLKRDLVMHEDCYRFGKVAAVVTDVRTFLERVDRAINENQIEGSRGLVEYFDDSQVHGRLDAKPGFYKRKRFEHQCEYRILVQVPGGSGEPYRLSLGELSDIVRVVPLEEICRTFSIRLPDGSTA